MKNTIGKDVFKMNVQELASEIANFLNEVNRNCFSERELIEEIIPDYIDMIENQDLKELFEVLNNEIINTERDFPEHAQIAKNFIKALENIQSFANICLQKSYIQDIIRCIQDDTKLDERRKEFILGILENDTNSNKKDTYWHVFCWDKADILTGFSFPCDESGELLDELQSYALENYNNCIHHKFDKSIYDMGIIKNFCIE